MFQLFHVFNHFAINMIGTMNRTNVAEDMETGVVTEITTPVTINVVGNDIT